MAQDSSKRRVLHERKKEQGAITHTSRLARLNDRSSGVRRHQLEGPMTVSAAVERLGVAKSTAHWLLSMLSSAGTAS